MNLFRPNLLLLCFISMMSSAALLAQDGLWISAPSVNAVIPSCADEVLVNFSITVHDPNGPRDPADNPLAITFPCGGITINDIFGLQTNNNVGVYDVAAVANADFLGNCVSMPITYTDANGQTAQVITTYTISEAKDVDVVLDANDIEFTVYGCYPTTLYTYSFSIYDCAGFDPDELDVIPPPGFSIFGGYDIADGHDPKDLAALAGSEAVRILYIGDIPQGLHAFEIDYRGLTAVPLVTINQAVNTDDLYLACNDKVNITLDEYTCKAPLMPDNVLEGFPEGYYCQDGYYVKIIYPYDGHSINYVRKCGEFKYVAYKVNGYPDWIDGDANAQADYYEYPDYEICWGYVNAEDKTPPYGCISKVVALHKRPVQYKKEGDYIYSTKEAKKIDGKFWIYDPVTCDYDDYCDDDIFGRDYLDSPFTNLLICTDVDSIYNIPYSWNDPEYAYYTGTPHLYDACSEWEPKVTAVYDRLEDYECGYKYDRCTRRLISAVVYRTFVFEDEKGNEGKVEQQICFYKPFIYLPDCKEVLDVCWYGDVDPDNTEEELAPEVIGSIPYYKNGICMVMYLDEHVCNVTATYEDLVLPGPEKCGFKVIRNWTILDWCWNEYLYNDPTDGPVELMGNEYDYCPYPRFSDWHNKALTYEQHIIIGDDTDPVVECPDYYYNEEHSPIIVSTGPFDCESALEVPAPKVVSKECAYTWTVKVYTYVPVLWHGVPTGEYTREEFSGANIIEDIDKDAWVTKSVKVVGVPKGRHYLIYEVSDHCGNTGYSDYCEFYVLDEIEPVAICDDDLTVSLSAGAGGDANAYGFGRVYAKDVDEGSWDNCTDVYLQVRRFVPEECVDDFTAGSTQALETKAVYIDKPGTLADGKKGYWTVWADYVDFVCCDIGPHPEDGRVLVELGVWDNANMSFDEKSQPIYGDNVKPKFGDYYFPYKQKDNFNTCWLEVLIEDKIAPTCVAPHDIYLTCKDVPYYASIPEGGTKWADLSETEQDNIKRWFGEISEPAKGWDNCDVTVEMIDVIFKVHCKSGYLERRFQATDAWGRTSDVCKQRIYLSRHHDYCIKFPKDAEAQCLEDPEIPGVELFEYGCDLLAVSVQDERFDVPSSSDECYKLFRTYRVLNWCQFDEDVDPATPLFDRFDTYYDIEPLVVSRDEDADGYPGDEDVYVRFIGWEVDKDNKNEIRRDLDKWGFWYDGYELIEEGTAGATWIDNDCDPFNYPHYDEEDGYWRRVHYTRGFYQYTQVVKVFDADPPVVVITGDDKFPSYAGVDKGDKEDTFKNGLPEVCVGDIALEVEVTEACTPDYVDLKKIYLLPDSDLGVGTILLYSNGSTTDDGAAFNFEVAGSGNKFTITGTFPIGTHELEIHGQDGCGNADADFVTFTVYDAKAPAPICISGLSIELMPDGEGGGAMTVWANDFIASDIWDCSEPIFYTIHRAEEVDSLLAAGEEIVPGDDDTAVTVTCDDPEVVLVYIFAWDDAGNGDRCEAMLLINDFMGLCGPVPGATIAGAVTTDNGDAIEDVLVNVSGQMDATFTTNASGAYVFNGLDLGGDYTVAANLDKDPLNGVSTFDLVLISKDILGTKRITVPYRRLAADVNRSNQITTLDLIQIRRLILGIDTKFANAPSWIFVDADYEFSDTPLTDDVPRVINFNNLTEEQLSASFIGIKMGDVNGNAVPNSLLTEGRTMAGVLTLDVQDQTLVAGNEYEVTFTTQNLADIQGYQFTLNHTEAVEIADVKYGVATEENFGFARLDDRALTTSWNGEVVEGSLFTLVLRATADAELRDVLSVSSRYTRAEAYNTNNELLDVAISFNGELASTEGFKLYQNTPNPFKGETLIGFDLPEAADGTLTVFDINGKALQVVRRTFDKGYNQVTFKSGQLPAGVLSYTLETGDFAQTRKMIRIDD